MLAMNDPDGDRRADVLRLAAATGCDPRTARRWIAGQTVTNVSAKALEEAALKLGITPPEQ